MGVITYGGITCIPAGNLGFVLSCSEALNIAGALVERARYNHLYKTELGEKCHIALKFGNMFFQNISVGSLAFS